MTQIKVPEFLLRLGDMNKAPMLMGILNLSPDSFSHDGKSGAIAIEHAKQMVEQGASIIDIGAESTRPGAAFVDLETEWQRLYPVLEPLGLWLKTENAKRLAKGLHKVWLSVDTYKAEIACRSLKLGADIINDVSGGQNETEIWAVMAEARDSIYILMHNPFALKGMMPHSHKESITYTNPVQDIAFELGLLYNEAVAVGCRNIIIDPGLGFGKDVVCNWQVLANLENFCRAVAYHIGQDFKNFCPPILVGASNKRFVRHWQEQEESMEIQSSRSGYARFLSANLAVCALAIQGGARIIRSHEVLEHYRCIRSVWEFLKYRAKFA